MIILAAIVGAALSGAGATLQGVFRNPLVDPFILGLSAGAAFGCALSVAFLPALPIQVSAFIFSLIASAVAYGLAKSQGRISRLPLVLSGIVVSAFFSALVSILKFMVDQSIVTPTGSGFAISSGISSSSLNQKSSKWSAARLRTSGRSDCRSASTRMRESRKITLPFSGCW